MKFWEAYLNIEHGKKHSYASTITTSQPKKYIKSAVTSYVVSTEREKYFLKITDYMITG